MDGLRETYRWLSDHWLVVILILYLGWFANRLERMIDLLGAIDRKMMWIIKHRLGGEE